MASNFFIVHHTFKPGMAEKWWANMNDYDEAKQKTHQENWAKAGVYCHTFMPTAKVKDQCFVFGKQKKEFQIQIFKILLMVLML